MKDINMRVKLILHILTALLYIMTSKGHSEEIIYLHNDILGNTISSTDTSRNVLWLEEFYPYGKKLNLEGEQDEAWYSGYQYDSDFDLSYVNARYYDSNIGRFLSVDPVRFVEDNSASFNKYAYANNNPYKFNDKTGEYADLIIEAASLGIGVYSLDQNIQQGNYGAAALDAVGLVADGILAVVPGVPGAVGLSIQASRKTAGAAGESIIKSGDTTVYQATDPETGEVIYVGITKNIPQRAATHRREKGISIEPIIGLENIDRAQARGVEQVLIELFGMANKNEGPLLNKINSISKDNSKYNDAVATGRDILKEIGYPGDTPNRR
ncbi:RHS repeat-associated core domain-containing protein [Microbulbifer epialgicus]|uniref:RHS repeat-associated core domain-containing protein n=1 Tax=Microbulbifer epialgicus TaxID=393907 RepID=A0ABV4NVN9_9GAMM